MAERCRLPEWGSPVSRRSTCFARMERRCSRRTSGPSAERPRRAAAADGRDFHPPDLIVLSPGVPVDIAPVEAARAKGIPVIGEVELASYFLKGPICGITGSNGKTTTTALIGQSSERMRDSLSGRGQYRDTADGDGRDIARRTVERVGTVQLPTRNHRRIPRKHRRLHKLTPDHLDRHHTLENYAGAKGRLFETQTSSDQAVLNADDQTCVSYASRTRATPHWFSRRITPKSASTAARFLWRRIRSSMRTSSRSAGFITSRT